MSTQPNGPPQGTGLARKAEKPIILDLIQRMQPQIKAALPNLGITPERMVRMALTCLRNTPKLMECEQQTVLAGIVELAQLGLEPATPLGHAWLLPYGRRAQVIIGYKGFIALADRAGITLGAEVVYEADDWVYPRPGDVRINHVPYEGDGPRGQRMYAYAYAVREHRPLQFKVVTRRDIERARASSAAVQGSRKDSPWFGDERGKPEDVDAMWRKTAIRRMAPFLPMSAESQTRFVRALELDEQAEIGLEQMFDLTPAETRTEVQTDDLEKRLRDAQDGPRPT